jgi:hypothetical protein
MALPATADQGWPVPTLHLLLVGVTLAVGPGVAGVSRGVVVVLREASGSLLVVFAEVAGAGFCHAHEREAGVVQSGKSRHRRWWA